MGLMTWDERFGIEVWDLRLGTWDLGLGIWFDGRKIVQLGVGFGIWELGVGIWD